MHVRMSELEEEEDERGDEREPAAEVVEQMEVDDDDDGAKPATVAKEEEKEEKAEDSPLNIDLEKLPPPRSPLANEDVRAVIAREEEEKKMAAIIPPPTPPKPKMVVAAASPARKQGESCKSGSRGRGTEDAVLSEIRLTFSTARVCTGGDMTSVSFPFFISGFLRHITFCVGACMTCSKIQQVNI